MTNAYRAGFRDGIAAAHTQEWKPTHRHKASGGEYVLLSVGKMQSSHWRECFHDENGHVHACGKVDEAEVAIYVGKDGQYWVRPYEEFLGRFEPIAPAPKGGAA